jgi:hypothetical protein
MAEKLNQIRLFDEIKIRGIYTLISQGSILALAMATLFHIVTLSQILESGIIMIPNRYLSFHFIARGTIPRTKTSNRTTHSGIYELAQGNSKEKGCSEAREGN